MADGLLEVWEFGYSRFESATGENVVITLWNITTLYVLSGKDKSHSAPVTRDTVGHSLK
jgi:hypothetical protein